MSSKKRYPSALPGKSPKKQKITGSLDAFFHPRLQAQQGEVQAHSLRNVAPAKAQPLGHLLSGDTVERAIVIEDEDERPVPQSNEPCETIHSVQRTSEPPQPATVLKPTQIYSDESLQLGPLPDASSAESFSQYPNLGSDPLTFDASQCPWPRQRPAPYSFLAHVLSHLSQTKSRILLLNTLTNALRSLIVYDPEAIVPALYMVSNSISAPYVPVELAVGPKILSSALMSISGLTSAALKRVSWKISRQESCSQLGVPSYTSLMGILVT